MSSLTKRINFTRFSSCNFLIFFTLERGSTSLDFQWFCNFSKNSKHFIEIEMNENECVFYKFQLDWSQCCQVRGIKQVQVHVLGSGVCSLEVQKLAKAI
jgi:hypothetical protein